MERPANIDAADMAVVASLKARRERLGLTQSEVAAALKDQGLRLDQSGLSRAELGKRALTVGEASAYARALSTTLDEVLRNDPFDDFVAEARAGLRALEQARTNSLAALLAYSNQMDRYKLVLNQAKELIATHERDAAFLPRIEKDLMPAIQDSWGLVSEEAEDRIALALDELEQTTTHSLALRKSREGEI